MYKTKKIGYISLSGVISLCLVLSGCSPSWEQKSVGTGKEREEEQQKFMDMEKRLFQEEMKKNAMSLHFLLAEPEKYGINDYKIDIGEYSIKEMRKERKQLKDMKRQVEEFQYDLLTEEQQLTYEIIMEYVDTELLGEGLELYANPLSPTIGIQAELPMLFSEYSFYTEKDVEEYLELLSQVDEYFTQLIQFEEWKSKEGLFMSDETADKVIVSCERSLADPSDSFLTHSFLEKLDNLPLLTKEEKEAYKERHKNILENDFIPAYEILIKGIEKLKGREEMKLEFLIFPKGKEYYEYLVASSTFTSYETVEEVRDAILERMEWEERQILKILTENKELLENLDGYEFAFTDPLEILSQLKEEMKGRFPKISEVEHHLKYVPESLEDILSPAMCLTPPIDRPQDNAIYINRGEEFKHYDWYTVLAHEGYPGHLYQSIYFLENNSSLLRTLMTNTSYVEGWATYVEYLSYEFDNGLDPNLGKAMAHDSAISLAVSALLDIYIHYDGWGKEEVSNFLKEEFGDFSKEAIDDIYGAIVDNPVNYLQYYIGYLEIANMRRMGEEGKKGFREKDFHTFLLEMGPAPFSIIKSRFEKESWNEKMEE